MAKKNDDSPPASPSLVKELLCPQLLAALICSGAFTFTIIKPIPKLEVPAVDKPVRTSARSPEANTAELDNDKIFEKIEAVPCVVLLRKGEKEKAIAGALEIANSREKRKDPVLLIASGTVLVAGDNTPQQKWKGNVILEKAVKVAPKSRYVKLMHARRLYDQGRMSDAIKAYEECLNLSPPDWVTPRLELANLYMMNEEGKKALDMFKEVNEITAKDPDPRILKRQGITIAVNGDQKAGFDKFIEGSNMEYDTPDYLPEIKKLVDKHAGLIESAITEAREDVDKNPDDIHKRITLARLLISVNRLKLAQDQLLEARKKLEANPETHEVLAECLYRMKNADESQAEFATAARLEPLNKPAAPPNAKYLPTWEDTHEEEELDKEPVAAQAK